ncbi:Hypothetical_protein [Hexamita inflata]|uniref:Hypothetical_protein n=1 Tax=Hexamita inflata TaxID=28002 RepID=A0AA86P5Y0_9EUKA|nr:Hypothetical protein HINF_LOCUS19903 [Hexamita inflata]
MNKYQLFYEMYMERHDIQQIAQVTKIQERTLQNIIARCRNLTIGPDMIFDANIPIPEDHRNQMQLIKQLHVQNLAQQQGDNQVQNDQAQNQQEIQVEDDAVLEEQLRINLEIMTANFHNPNISQQTQNAFMQSIDIQNNLFDNKGEVPLFQNEEQQIQWMKEQFTRQMQQNPNFRRVFQQEANKIQQLLLMLWIKFQTNQLTEENTVIYFNIANVDNMVDLQKQYGIICAEVMNRNILRQRQQVNHQIHEDEQNYYRFIDDPSEEEPDTLF